MRVAFNLVGFIAYLILISSGVVDGRRVSHHHHSGRHAAAAESASAQSSAAEFSSSATAEFAVETVAEESEYTEVTEISEVTEVEEVTEISEVTEITTEYEEVTEFEIDEDGNEIVIGKSTAVVGQDVNTASSQKSSGSTKKSASMSKSGNHRSSSARSRASGSMSSGSQVKSSSSAAAASSASASSSSSAASSMRTSSSSSNNMWQNYFINEFDSLKSLDLTSSELQNKIYGFFNNANSYSYWENLIKDAKYRRYLAVSTGYTGNLSDDVKFKEHILKVASEKPRLLAVGFEQVAKNLESPSSELQIAKLAKEKYNIHDDTNTNKDWKTQVIKEFGDFKSTGDIGSLNLKEQVSSMLGYEADGDSFLDSVLKNQQYAEFLTKAVGYTEPYNEKKFREFLKIVAEKNPKLLALGFRSISKNLKDSTSRLEISPTAQKIINDNLLEKTSLGPGTTNFNHIETPVETSTAVETTTESTIDTTHDEPSTTSQTVTTGYVNSLCTCEHSSSETQVSASDDGSSSSSSSSSSVDDASSPEGFTTINTSSLTKDSTPTLDTPEPTNVGTKEWEVVAINEFADLKSSSIESEEASERIDKFFRYTNNGLEKMLKTNNYAQYLAYSTGFTKDWTDTASLLEHLKTIGKTQPRILASSLRYVTRNIKNSEEKLTVGKLARKEFKIKDKAFETKEREYFGYLGDFFRNAGLSASSGSGSSELTEFIENFWQYNDGMYLDEILANDEYLAYLKKLTRYTGQSSVSEFRTYLLKNFFKENSRYVALALKQIYLNAHNSVPLEIPANWSTYYDERALASTTKTSGFSSFLYNNFYSIAPQSISSSEMVTLLDTFTSSDGGLYLNELLDNDDYYAYLVKAFEYKGDYKNKRKFYEYMTKTIFKKRSRFAVLCLQNIIKNYKFNEKLVVPSYQAKASNANIRTSCNRKTQSYLVTNFYDLDSDEIETYHFSTLLHELSKKSYLDDILNQSIYAEYLATVLQYKGDWSSEAFKTYIKRTAIRERSYALALALKRIAYHIMEQRELEIPYYVYTKYNVGQNSRFSISGLYDQWSLMSLFDAFMTDYLSIDSDSDFDDDFGYGYGYGVSSHGYGSSYGGAASRGYGSSSYGAQSSYGSYGGGYSSSYGGRGGGGSSGYTIVVEDDSDDMDFYYY